MLGLALAVLLGATPGAVKLASPGLTGVQINKEVALFYSDHLAQQLALRGLSVMTATEINSMLGLERQKQLMGCSSESSSCTAELADALGVDGIVTGSIGRFDRMFQIDVKVVAAADGRKLALYSGAVNSEREVLDALSSAAEMLTSQTLISLGREPAPRAVTAGGAKRFWWIPASIGAVGIVLGSVLLGMASGHESALRGTVGMPSMLTYEQAKGELAAGSTKQAIGITALAVGGAALLAAGALLLFGSNGATVSPTVSTTGGGVMLMGRFP